MSLSKAQQDILAREIAMQVDSPQGLAERFNLPPQQIQAMLDSPEFVQKVKEYDRELLDSGDRIRIRARTFIEEILPTLAETATTAIHPSDRSRAIELLTKLAALAADNEQPTLTINIQGVDDIQALRNANPYRNTTTSDSTNAFKPVTIDVTPSTESEEDAV